MDYLKNIVLNYMLDDDHQPQLVGVLAKLLHFTQEEIQKVLYKRDKKKVSFNYFFDIP
jgi:hypothetical protein